MATESKTGPIWILWLCIALGMGCGFLLLTSQAVWLRMVIGAAGGGVVGMGALMAVGAARGQKL